LKLKYSFSKFQKVVAKLNKEGVIYKRAEGPVSNSVGDDGDKGSFQKVDNSFRKEFWYAKSDDLPQDEEVDQIINKNILNDFVTPRDEGRKTVPKPPVGSTPFNPEQIDDDGLSRAGTSDLPTEVYKSNQNNGKDLDRGTASDDSFSTHTIVVEGRDMPKRKRKVPAKLDGFVGFEPQKRRAHKKGT
jgi:hypothetical protein